MAAGISTSAANNWLARRTVPCAQCCALDTALLCCAVLCCAAVCFEERHCFEESAVLLVLVSCVGAVGDGAVRIG
eukprot:1855057-Rhodomonas_salina.1